MRFGEGVVGGDGDGVLLLAFGEDLEEEFDRLLRITALPRPRRDRDHLLSWSAWRRHHQHQAAEAHRRWNNIAAAATT
ncbi:hypothetical protein [Streptomyces sp. NRRL F-525]|uniref:hypothetical protein n=1 Tax=Streptomyces sp. NRRL F-525 TaxID=1463861 RepID=UPI0005262877|nr:hypothetical protein [Streptomyces sp. NRRL F-525]